MLTSPSLPFFTLRIALCSATISAWKTVQKGSSRSVEYQVSSRPAIRSGRTDFALNTASVGVDLRPDHRETVHRLEVEVRRSRTRSRARAQGEASRRNTRVSRAPGRQSVPKSFPRFTSYNQAASLTLMSRGAASKDQRGMQGHCAVSPHALRAMLRWTASSILRTPSFLSPVPKRTMRTARLARLRSARELDVVGLLLDRRSRLPGEHEDHIIRERLNVYAEFPEFSE
ncbi:hypothetical protein EVAR_77676_1 [Eumeta japonica]|uniref:Uncharacterized protein n=1 Tax=Eumeta variegata TaxID=151549 RepID=A0A4C2A7A2_EUMVA|nr:hypothetical protein EVAR_77676_1 [Eumeta japonica]